MCFHTHSHLHSYNTIHIPTRTNIHMHIQTHSYTYPLTQTYIHISTHIHTSTYPLTHTFTYAFTHVHIPHSHAFTYALSHTHLQTYLHLHTHTGSIDFLKSHVLIDMHAYTQSHDHTFYFLKNSSTYTYRLSSYEPKCHSCFTIYLWNHHALFQESGSRDWHGDLVCVCHCMTSGPKR